MNHFSEFEWVIRRFCLISEPLHFHKALACLKPTKYRSTPVSSTVPLNFIAPPLCRIRSSGLISADSLFLLYSFLNELKRTMFESWRIFSLNKHCRFKNHLLYGCDSSFCVLMIALIEYLQGFHMNRYFHRSHHLEHNWVRHCLPQSFPRSSDEHFRNIYLKQLQSMQEFSKIFDLKISAF